MAEAKRDGNYVPTLLAVSSADGTTPVPLYADPTTHRLYVDLAAGSGTVTSVSVVTANGFSGSVANATTTPAITIDASALNAAKIADGSVSNTEFQYLDGVSSAIQTQIDGKQPLDSDLTTLAGLTATTNNFIVSVASAWASRTPAQVKTTLSLDAVENTALSTWAGTTNITTLGTITTGTWNATDIAVADGGTGRSTSTTAYGLIAAGTTATGAHQTLAAGATTEILVGGGAAALPVWTTAQGSGAPVRATSPTLTTPVLGVATATSVNGLTITTTTGTITMTNAKTLAVTNTLTLSGTDSTVMTFPSTTQTIAGLTSTQTFTNKRITKREVTTASTATLTIDSDATDIATVTAQAAGLTIAAPTGTPTQGQPLVIRIKDNGTSRSLTWNATFKVMGVTLPAATTISKLLYVGTVYNSTSSQWDVLAINQEA